MEFIFLPKDGRTWLFFASHRAVTPLVLAPGEFDSILRVSEDGKEFGCIDQVCKRVGHYRFLTSAPWFESVDPPLALPRSCYANDLVIYKGHMVVGGHSNSGESLWLRDSKNNRKWIPLELPNGLAKRGKSIDALYVRRSNLIAIDNIVTPKWILVYELEPNINATTVGIVPLRVHMTTEIVKCTAEGTDFYALQSVGVNHGNVCLFISLLDKETFAECACWTFIKKINHFSPFTGLEKLLQNEISLEEISKEIDASDADILPTNSERSPEVIEASEFEIPYGKITSMKFCDRYLFICADDLFVTTIPAKTNDKFAPLPEFRKYPLSKLIRVSRLECLIGLQLGMCVIGYNSDECLDYEWIFTDAIAQFTIKQIN